jgi:hypothetical protein
VVTEEAARLRDANAKLSQDLDGELHGPSPLLDSPPASHWILIRWPWLQGRA